MVVQTLHLDLWDKHQEKIAELKRDGWVIVKEEFKWVTGNGSKPLVKITAVKDDENNE